MQVCIFLCFPLIAIEAFAWLSSFLFMMQLLVICYACLPEMSCELLIPGMGKEAFEHVQ